MRIIAGKLGGRYFAPPRGHRTHPMSDKARGGLFNALGDLEGLTILDAFAGSGALSFEAVSRGAASSLAVEIDRLAHDAITAGIAELELSGQVKAVRANTSSWSDNNPDVQFDVVIAAPPYDNLQHKLVQKLARHTKNGGLYVLDWPKDVSLPEYSDLELISHKPYGDATLAFYRKIS